MKKVIFLHHSTGKAIWRGNTNRDIYRIRHNGDVQKFFKKYNRKNNTNYQIFDNYFPLEIPYGGKNYPFDYYFLWVKNSNCDSNMEESTLEILTNKYDVIIFKHCFPAGFIMEDSGVPDINSEERRIENYKLQYLALKQKMHDFPHNKFNVWTIPALLQSKTTKEQAKRTYGFNKWVVEEWNEQGDNIYMGLL